MRMLIQLSLLFIPLLSFSQQFSHQEIERYKAEAQRVTIIRDNWFVPHIYGKTDADAVFGLLYAQCEESFQKVEENNLEMLGRLSEVYGESRLYDDLEMRLIYDTAAAKRDYNNSPLWLKKLLDAAADGVNYYLYKHPEVKPKVLTHFEPWFALLRTNGSISATQDGGISVNDMKNLYPAKDSSVAFREKENPYINNDPMGSNGFAVAPQKTTAKNAILYINPHVTFYYRSEMQMASDEGLNAYGAVTWGTFFIFQGFNQYCGWMHTSGEADVADLFTEKIIKRGDSLYTQYDDQLLPVTAKTITIRYKKDDGFGEQTFTTYHTIHGPVMGSRNGQWLSLRENNRSLPALEQSWLRTKAKGFEEFKQVMNLRSNTSDNTVFADYKGNIAYWHGNFVPRRNTKYDYSLPVDGSTSATDWKGIYALDSIVHVYNPATGFIQNCNSTPFTVSGESSPKPENYPVYMAPDGENYRGITAARLLSNANDLTVESMIKNIGYNHYLALFDDLLPVLLNDYTSLASTDSLKQSLGEAITLLTNWNKSAADTSVASTIAIEFGYRFLQKVPPVTNLYNATHLVEQLRAAIQHTTALERLQLLSETLKDLSNRFGTWRTAWGNVNRYQRPVDGVFDDAKRSMAVGFAASNFGSIPAFATRRFPNTVKRYGFNGNSFIACVEFGKKIKAKSVITGGQSFNPQSPHYLDQAEMYINGNFKNVLFYKEDVMKHVEKSYHPGE
ncbi:penicillin acylase family protein [Ilyomonas limi]|uniref:Penicillin acylase family protein n=2 Tax=Ilyomonas limi TaxID=2575867 RepID=A0A4V6XAV4_9BACT|nr:penicillin acylase family protein [Ilyomonas limi]